MKNKSPLLSSTFAFAMPLAYALLMHALFVSDVASSLLTVMTVSFLLFLPASVGALTVYLSNTKLASRKLYRILAPWVPVFGFFIATALIFKTEGSACWIMVFPIFLIASSLGGWLGGHIKVRDSQSNSDLQISLLALIPLLISPLESLVETIPGTYDAYTVIQIHSPAKTIWQNVIRVPAIPAKADKGYLTKFLGLPRPVEAILNFEGVGAYRKAIFTNGLVFHETVSKYQDQKKMVFSIKAYPHEIPAATMDEHVVIGGKYFDVLDGTYELEKLTDTSYKLHLYSHFKMNTTFNFYAGLWGKWIMKDIQNNILQVIKARAEGRNLD